MKLSDYHVKYFAYELTKRISSDNLEKLSNTLSNAQVDLNPHQIEAALFAFRSPLSKGAILADEVGLGKTIEAGLVLSQKWAERKRKILLIVPSSLRKQWNSELQEKFFLPSTILETKSFNENIKAGNLNPFIQDDSIVICSYHFARSKSPYIKQIQWDLVVIDEAHRLRNVYRSSNKIAKEIKDSIKGVPKILLTATPLQNSLLELYGLVSIIDDYVFGDLASFKDQYARVSREQDMYENELGLVEPKQEKFTDLRERLKQVCIRTLRRQVLEYIKYTKRIPITQDYVPTEQEIELYNGMSEYLQRETLFALPSSQRQLMTLILRKLLASSSFAIASTLDGLVKKLELMINDAVEKNMNSQTTIPGLEENFETYSETKDEWIDDEEEETEEKETDKKDYTEEDIKQMKQEKADLEVFRDLAKNIWTNSKGESLLIAIEQGFKMTQELGAAQKAIIFTESTITQNYLYDLLSKNGYEGKILLFNGSNSDPKSKDIYQTWLDKNRNTDKATGSKTADMRAALVDYFENEAEIMIATEAAAEGVNLQFCSLVINYDLPWNPQRIEQRIGRCHRYGQKHDVVVINFVNRKNAADKRVYELLDEKFKLFKGVFGASDEVLGTIESGVDFEKRIAAIYQSCRSEDDINKAFDALQNEMDEAIKLSLRDTRQKLLENFDAEVHEKLKLNLRESQIYLDRYERWLWDTTKYFLGDKADFASNEYSFILKQNPFSDTLIDSGPYRIGKNVTDAHIYRPGHPLAQLILKAIKDKPLGEAKIVFDYSNNGAIVSVLHSLVGKSGTLMLSNLMVEAFDAEDYILITAIDHEGNQLDQETAKKLFSLSADIQSLNSEISGVTKDKLKALEHERVHEITINIAERNGKFFENEVEKLDKWAEDMKKALELDLKRLDIEIKTAKTESKKIVTLSEKVSAQRKIKEMEKKRNEMRKKLYEAQDQVEDKKEQLLEKVEAQLQQRTHLEPLFIAEWEIV